MDAGTAENLLRHLPNFVGIYFARDLDKLAVLDFPSAFLIFHEQHWIALFIDTNVDGSQTFLFLFISIIFPISIQSKLIM